MKKIRFLTIRFDTDIEPHELPAFRGAIIEKVGRELINFHNHRPEGGYQYRYPVIQYKRMGRNPAIICLEEGTDDIQQFFQQRTWDVSLNGRPLTLAVKDLRLQHYAMQVWEHTFCFKLRDWLALNETNYARYQYTPDEGDRLALLERTLRGNILSLASGLGWYIDREVKVQITQISPLRWLTYKQQKMAGFDIEFLTNVFLPDWIGLGKGVSIGFGVVRRERKERQPATGLDSPTTMQPDDK